MRPRREIRTKCNLIILTKGINVNRKKLNKAKTNTDRMEKKL